MAYDSYSYHQQQQQHQPDEPQPVSRTYQYRKVMKPMLERKRRARINRCLDELKELMVSALQAEGENVAKLEKADILELTVRHLHKLRRKRKLSLSEGDSGSGDRFRAGFTHAAAEVSRCLAQTPGVDVALGTKLMTHLGHRLNDMDESNSHLEEITNTTSSPCSSPAPSSTSSAVCYGLPLTPACSPEPSFEAEDESHHEPLDCSTAGLMMLSGGGRRYRCPPIADEDSVWRPW